MFAVLADNFELEELEQLASSYLGSLPAAGNSTSETSPNPFSRSHLNQVAFVPTQVVRNSNFTSYWNMVQTQVTVLTSFCSSPWATLVLPVPSKHFVTEA